MTAHHRYCSVLTGGRCRLVPTVAWLHDSTSRSCSEAICQLCHLTPKLIVTVPQDTTCCLYYSPEAGCGDTVVGYPLSAAAGLPQANYLIAAMGVRPAPHATATLPMFSTESSILATTTVAIAGVGGESTPGASQMGAGGSSQLLALPAKLTKKILDLEYVEMTELLPEVWRGQEEDPKCCHQRKGQHRGPITDILMWTECYTSLVSVLATRHADKTPQFMAYLRTIVKAQRAFSGDGWVTYDSCY